jgi:PAS domain S-box-containing protein
VLFWNRGAREMYGWTAEEARGKELGQLLGSDREAWTTLNAELEQSGAWEGELHQIRRDGTPITVHSREVLVRDEHGGPSAVLSIKRDITEFRHLVEALKEADRRKDEFLALLAHELRNPLAPLRNSIEVMRLAGNDPAAVGKTREILDRQVKQLAHIVEDLIDVTRIVEKKIALQKERVRLSDVVETAVETCRSVLHGAQDQLMIDLPRDPLYLDADPVRLAQVIINLLQNAIKFTPPGGQIWITAQRVPAKLIRDPGQPEADDVVLRVRDSGVGIPSGLLPHVFEMFVQGEHSGLQGRSGLGVGLALVQSLVQMHGGHIEAHSAGPEQGSEFVVRLPLSVPPSPADQPTQMARPKAAASAKRILVVDDNPDQVESLGMLLQVMGH